MQLRPTILLAALLSIGGWFAYKYLWATTPSFPVDRTLTDQQGRSVEVRILARNDLEIQFVRLKDGEVFRYPIGYLSEQDQAYVFRFPISQLKTRDSAPEVLAVGPPEQEKLLAKRADLKVMIKLIKMDLGRPDPNRSGYPASDLRRHIDELENELVDVDQALLKLAYKEQSTELFGRAKGP